MMRLNEGVLFFFIAVAVLTLVAGYILEGTPGLAVAFGVVGLTWWAAARRFGNVFIPMGFFIFTVGAVSGVLAGLNFSLMLASLLSALGAWDMLRFRQRLARVEASSETEALETHHVGKLAAVLLLGAGLSLLAASLEVRFGFWLVAAVAVILLFSLERVLSLIKKSRREA